MTDAFLRVREGGALMGENDPPGAAVFVLEILVNTGV